MNNYSGQDVYLQSKCQTIREDWYLKITQIRDNKYFMAIMKDKHNILLRKLRLYKTASYCMFVVGKL